MKNYINIENTKIELTEEQVRQLREIFDIPGTKLSEIAVGETFKLGQYEFVVLEHRDNTTAVILKELLKDEQEFSETNNSYSGSLVDGICNSFGEEIAKIVGEDNLVEHTVDLTTDDGLKCYGTIERRMSLLTADAYRRYVELLDKHNPSKWWWLATAHSTSKHQNDSWVKCVSPSGDVGIGNYFNKCGVRPFCILKSNIFVSK